MSTGVRVLLRRHVLQHDGADEPDERGGDDHAEKSHESHQRAEGEIGGRLVDDRHARVTVPAVCHRPAVLDVTVARQTLLLYSRKQGLKKAK